MAYIQKRKNRGGSVSWLAQVKVRPFRIPTKSFATRAEAAAWAEEQERALKDQRKRGGVREDFAELKVRSLIEEFLADPETKALRTFADTERLLDWWTNELAAVRCFELNVLKLRESRGKLHRGRSVGTVNRYLSALRSCWNRGRAAGLIPADRAWPARLMLSEPAGRVRYLTDAERARLLRAAAADPLMRAAIVVSLSTGMRQGELLRLEWRDIDFERATVVIRVTKTDKPRSVFLAQAARDALKALRSAPVVSPTYVFVLRDGRPLRKGLLEARWRKIRTAAALDDFRWHDLRHSCASFLAQHGATLPQIGAVLGHASPAVTQRYSHLVEGAAVPGHDALDRALRGIDEG